MVAIGLALIVQAIAGSASAISPRLLLGVLFVAAGVGRGYIEIRRSRGRELGDGPRAAGTATAAEPAPGAAPSALRRSWRPRSRVIARRSIGSPILFTIVYTSLASAIYFSLGVVAGHALGLTPLVFLVAAVLFMLTAMTYVEGASLHQDGAARRCSRATRSTSS